MLPLHCVVAREGRQARRRGQEQVATLHEISDLRRGAVDAEPVGQRSDEFDSERLISMFSGVLNCSRMDAADRVVEAVR